jgi:hypothetical protein
MDIKGSAREYLLAAAKFDRNWLSFWRDVEPLPDDRFLELLPLLRVEVEKFRFRHKRTDGVRDAAREFCRKAVTKENEDRYSPEDGLRFAKAYERMKGRLARALDRVVEGLGDDSYSDLCDSLPLAGESIIQRALATHPKSGRPRREGFLDHQEVEDAVRELGQGWHGFIWNGENYICDALKRATRHYWLYLVRTGEDGTDWSPAEQQVLSWGDTPE